MFQPSKGQLISKGLFAIFTWTKKRTKNFCPEVIILSWVRAPPKEILFFLKSDLKLAFSDILIIFLFIWIKYISFRHFWKKKLKRKILPRTHESSIMEQYIFRAEIEKFFVRFLVQVKIAKSPFEINGPLAARQCNSRREQAWASPGTEGVTNGKMWPAPLAPWRLG